jgi:hypothetical protein
VFAGPKVFIRGNNRPIFISKVYRDLYRLIIIDGNSLGTAYLMIIFVHEYIYVKVAIIRSTVFSCNDDLCVLDRTIFWVKIPTEPVMPRYINNYLLFFYV